MYIVRFSEYRMLTDLKQMLVEVSMGALLMLLCGVVAAAHELSSLCMCWGPRLPRTAVAPFQQQQCLGRGVTPQDS